MGGALLPARGQPPISAGPAPAPGPVAVAPWLALCRGGTGCDRPIAGRPDGSDPGAVGGFPLWLAGAVAGLVLAGQGRLALQLVAELGRGQPYRCSRLPGAGGGALGVGGREPLGADHHSGCWFIGEVGRLAGPGGINRAGPGAAGCVGVGVGAERDRGAGPACGGLLDFSAPAFPHPRATGCPSGPGGP